MPNDTRNTRPPVSGIAAPIIHAIENLGHARVAVAGTIAEALAGATKGRAQSRRTFGSQVENIVQARRDVALGAIDTVRQVASGIARRSGPLAGASTATELSGSFEYDFELPGVSPDDVAVEVAEGSLRISASRRRGQEDEEELFERDVSLAESADPERVTANMANGVLRVSVGKKKEFEGRAIPVQQAEHHESSESKLDLMRLTRKDLNARARQAGVEEPDRMASKESVASAIMEARSSHA